MGSLDLEAAESRIVNPAAVAFAKTDVMPQSSKASKNSPRNSEASCVNLSSCFQVAAKNSCNTRQKKPEGDQ